MASIKSMLRKIFVGENAGQYQNKGDYTRVQSPEYI